MDNFFTIEGKLKLRWHFLICVIIADLITDLIIYFQMY